MKARGVMAACVTVVLLGMGVSGLARLYGTQEQPAPKDTEADAVKLISGYRQWTKANDEPKYVVPRVAPGSSGPLPVPQKTADPHEGKFLTVYVNETGREQFMAKKIPRFTEGTVIVGEKLPSRETNAAPELLTVMVKRAAGFDPQNKDWEYLVFDGPGKKVAARGKQNESCAECHEVQQPLDNVFRRCLNLEVLNQMR